MKLNLGFDWKKLKKSDPVSVFTLRGHHLPSQYRTLLPVHNAKVEKIMALDKRMRRMRCVALVLTSLLLVLFVTVLALLVAMRFASNDEPSKGRLVIEEVITLDDGHTEIVPVVRRKQYPPWSARCTKTCTTYSRSRFNATCHETYCRCHGDGYSELTCLPKFGDCIIQRRSSGESVKALYSGKPQNIYSCSASNNERHSPKIPHGAFPHINIQRSRGSGSEFSAKQTATKRRNNRPGTINDQWEENEKANLTEKFSDKPSDHSENREYPQRTGDVHVISLYGNYRTRFTTLELEGSSDQPFTLVLASEQPVQWKLSLKKIINLKAIVLLGGRQVSRSSVSIINDRSETTSSTSSSPPPTTTSLPSPTATSALTETVSSTDTAPSTQIQSHIAKNIYDNVDNEKRHNHHDNEGSIDDIVYRRSMKTGYGNDHLGGDTPLFLETITESIGRIRTFVGAAHADYIHVDLGFKNVYTFYK